LFSQTDMDEFEKYAQQQEQEFQNYQMQQDSMFIQYKDQIEKEWNEFVESSPNEWVTYSEDFKGRSQVDFEKGEVKVEAVVEEDEPQSEEKAKEIVKKQLTKILEEKDETEEPILKDQIKVKDVGIVTKENLDEAVEKIIETGKVTETLGKDEKKRTKYSIVLDMVPDNIQIRVNKYKPFIEEQCEKFEIDPGLALSIIHTESFFNPRAYNRHGNAYGMMQIVPKYAGTTMNYVIFNKKGKPSSSVLYNPENNLAMGIGYMRWLADNKWDEVTNKENQYYCIVCSYNGGPGSVYKAMTGKMRGISEKKWNKMMSSLSTMDNDALYKKLRKDIPWAETRKYIETVRSRREKYYKNL
ncbi:MAG: murein transglycosylase domain-containing protein, partial [Candidatus Cloacimonadota bacterium]|nr:murein transglycosylase domain-containing protein [Candidatus Cloacimonadota bacterium]